MSPLLLVRYGEIGLKGANRHIFEDQLMQNMRDALGSEVKARLRRSHGRIFVELADEGQKALAVQRLQRVFGIVAINPAVQVALDTEAIKDAALKLVEQQTTGKPTTFRVTARRPNKSFPLTSQQINEQVGAHLLRHVDGLSVRLTEPEMTVSVEVRKHAYVYVAQTDGPGGLPVGASSRAMLLLSGGIDSPVAGWMALKRGIRLEALHFHSPPFTSERSREKVVDLCRALAAWGGRIPLHTVHFTEIQTEIKRHCPESLGMTVMRRFMVRIAERFAIRTGSVALVTGESVGQVASQTLESMAAINAVTTTPILRPLVGFDKHEIISRAEAIDTYDISIRPYEDCCTIFVPERPATRPGIAEVEAAEAALDVDGLVERALDNIETETFSPEHVPV